MHARPRLATPAQGSAFYLGGAALVIIGWTMVGMLVEAYGFWLLFCEFIPTVLTYARRVPLVGRALEVPWLRTVSGARLAAWAVCWHVVRCRGEQATTAALAHLSETRCGRGGLLRNWLGSLEPSTGPGCA